MRRPFSYLLASLCLLTVWIATPLLSVAHLALEEHSYCAEHERLEEGAHAHAELDKDTGETHRAALRAASQESQDDHEGCAFTDDFTRECQQVVAGPTDFTLLMAHFASPFHATFRQQANDLLLTLAPKNSPPLSA